MAGCASISCMGVKPPLADFGRTGHRGRIRAAQGGAVFVGGFGAGPYSDGHAVSEQAPAVAGNKFNLITYPERMFGSDLPVAGWLAGFQSPPSRPYGTDLATRRHDTDLAGPHPGCPGTWPAAHRICHMEPPGGLGVVLASGAWPHHQHHAYGMSLPPVRESSGRIWSYMVIEPGGGLRRVLGLIRPRARLDKVISPH